MVDESCPYVSRGGLKLAAALEAFEFDVAGLTCADLGCNVGGFTDCLLQRGAKHVYSVDTGYGAFAWKLRNHKHITTLERTNAVHFDPHTLDGFAGCDLAVIDLGWTRQAHAIPAALRWLKQDDVARVITLIKPHYEADKEMLSRDRKGVLADTDAAEVLQRVIRELPECGVTVLNHIESPIRGGAGKGRIGNVEYLALLARASSSRAG